MNDRMTSIGAIRPGQLSGQRARQYGRGRVCPACDGKLSIYNPDEFCSSCIIEEKIPVGPEEMKVKDAAKLLDIDVRAVRDLEKQGLIAVHTKRRGLGTSYQADSVRAYALDLERGRIAEENARTEELETVDDTPDGNDLIDDSPIMPLADGGFVPTPASFFEHESLLPLGNGDQLTADAAASLDGDDRDEPCDGTDGCCAEAEHEFEGGEAPPEGVYSIYCQHHDAELVALEAMGDALGLLDHQARVRVIAWALDKFDLGTNVRTV